MKFKDYLQEGSQGFVKWIIKPKKKMAHLEGENDASRLVSYFNAVKGFTFSYDKTKDFLEREKPFVIPVVPSKKLREIINKQRFDIIDVTSSEDKVKTMNKESGLRV